MTSLKAPSSSPIPLTTRILTSGRGSPLHGSGLEEVKWAAGWDELCAEAETSSEPPVTPNPNKPQLNRALKGDSAAGLGLSLRLPPLGFPGHSAASGTSRETVIKPQAYFTEAQEAYQ